jgi:hypothetical protein
VRVLCEMRDASWHVSVNQKWPAEVSRFPVTVVVAFLPDGLAVHQEDKAKWEWLNHTPWLLDQKN